MKYCLLIIFAIILLFGGWYYYTNNSGSCSDYCSVDVTEKWLVKGGKGKEKYKENKKEKYLVTSDEFPNDLMYFSNPRGSMGYEKFKKI